MTLGCTVTGSNFQTLTLWILASQPRGFKMAMVACELVMLPLAPTGNGSSTSASSECVAPFRGEQGWKEG